MNASNIAKILTVISVVAAGLFLVRCELGQPPPEPAAKAVNCDGQPDWCLVARSEMDGRRVAYVYMDGKVKGLILPGKTLRIPVTAGETHQVNFCAYFDVAGFKQWKCTTPTYTKFDVGSSTLVVSPAITTLVACSGPNNPRPYC